MNEFFEKILRESPELQEEVIRFQQWGRNALFGASADTGRSSNAIASAANNDELLVRLEAAIYEAAREGIDRAIASAFRVPPSALVEERSLKTPVVNQANCKFYNGNTLLRCAVNPCVETCDGCTQFELKR